MREQFKTGDTVTAHIGTFEPFLAEVTVSHIYNERGQPCAYILAKANDITPRGMRVPHCNLERTGH